MKNILFKFTKSEFRSLNWEPELDNDGNITGYNLVSTNGKSNHKSWNKSIEPMAPKVTKHEKGIQPWVFWAVIGGLFMTMIILLGI